MPLPGRRLTRGPEALALGALQRPVTTRGVTFLSKFALLTVFSAVTPQFSARELTKF